MSCTKNLKPVSSTDEARQRGHAGGIASGIARRRKRDLRLAMLALLDSKKDGRTGTERLVAALFEKGLSGDTKAIALIWELAKEGNRKEREEEFFSGNLNALSED